ncbi:MAG: hypothetical protein FWG27_07065 [Treponema sp.]|nr:hypothetical protein [Treponema sp.]
MKRLMFTFVLIAGIIGFANAQMGDTWSPITSASSLIGKWTGTQSIEIPQNDEKGIPNANVIFSISLVYTRSNTDVTVEMKIDFTGFLDEWVKVPAMQNLKLTKDQLWKLITDLLSNIMEEGFAFDNKYNMFYSMTSDVDSLLNSDNISINQDKTMIKLVSDVLITFGLGDDGFTELILTKTDNIL